VANHQKPSLLFFAAARLYRVANHQQRFPRDAIAREQRVIIVISFFCMGFSIYWLMIKTQ
jgi:hypothetical protein